MLDFEDKVNEEDINRWLIQFKPDEQKYIKKLLNNFIYYGTNKVISAVKSLHKKVLASNSNYDIWYIPVGYVTKSGAIIAYYYRNENKLGEEKFILSNDINRIINKKNVAIVFIDDFVGSGHQAKQVWDYIVKPYYSKFENSKFFYCTLVGIKSGIEYIKNTTDLEVIVDRIIEKNELPFVNNSKVFEDKKEREIAKKIVTKYGESLYPGNPLGYKDSQVLIGFFYSTPNNTLPIFWSTNEKWQPLLPRNETYRDPNNLTGNMYGLDSGKSTLDLNDFDVSNEFITRGLNEFQKLPNLLALIKPIKNLQFSEDMFVKVINLIGIFKNYSHEKESVRTSVLLINTTKDIGRIGNYYIETPNLTLDNFKDNDTIKVLGGLIHNYSNTILIDNQGNIKGIVKINNESNNVYLPDEYKYILYATKELDGLSILCNGNDRVSIIYAGERILLYRGASWSLSPSNISTSTKQFSLNFKIAQDIIEKIFQIVLRMSYIGKGALITLGDEDKVLSYSEKPAADFVTNLDINLIDLSVDSAIGIFEQDGATIVNNQGKIVQAMSFLRPPTDTKVELELNRGSKHSTAVRISALTDALVIAISVDGRITFYKNGKIELKIMG